MEELLERLSQVEFACENKRKEIIDRLKSIDSGVSAVGFVVTGLQLVILWKIW